MTERDRRRSKPSISAAAERGCCRSSAVIYLTQQASFFSALDMGEAGSADRVKIAAWVVLSLVILAGAGDQGLLVPFARRCAT